jgi:hypothetical protein
VQYAGALVIDLYHQRNARLGDRALKFVLDRPELLTYWDQCALNHVVDGQFSELTKEWNFHQSCHLQWSAMSQVKFTKDQTCSYMLLFMCNAAPVAFRREVQPRRQHVLNEKSFHSERRPSARFPGDKDGSARRNIEPLQ